MMIRVSSSILLCLLLSIRQQVTAQVTSGARLTAMAGAGIALSDVWSLNQAQAGITGIEKSTASTYYQRHFLSTELSSKGLAIVIPFSHNAMGISFNTYGFSEYTDIKAGLSYAKKFGNKLSASLSSNYHQLKITNYGVSTSFSVDASIQYKLTELFTLGLLAQNPAKSKHQSTNAQAIAFIPSLIGIGAAWQISEKILLATSLINYINKQNDVRLGIEYAIFDLLSIRGGISSLPLQQYGGIGLKYKNFAFDSSVSSNPNLGYSPQLSISYAF